MSNATGYPTFESVYLLTQRNAEAIQKLGEKLDEMAVRDAEHKTELDKITKEMRRRTNKLEELFTSQWGKLVEALVDGKVVELLNERGIKVEQTSQRCEGVYAGKTQEIDILAINGEEIVAIEVKTTLRPEDIADFEDKLKVLKLWMRHYADKKVYGAVAYIRADAGSAKLAAKRGLFVIKAVGDSARMTNTKAFKPRSF